LPLHLPLHLPSPFGDKAMVQKLTAYSGDRVPVILPYKEVADGLKDRRIDCAEHNLPSYESTGNAKVAKFMYMSNHSATPGPRRW
ncbi:MAG: hypothetical protein ABI781_04210, partial [Burkholderiales bacterium]